MISDLVWLPHSSLPLVELWRRMASPCFLSQVLALELEWLVHGQLLLAAPWGEAEEPFLGGIHPGEAGEVQVSFAAGIPRG